MGKYDRTEEERRLIKLNAGEGDWRSPDKVLGPAYPDLGTTVAKMRARANHAGGIKKMARADVVAYADAIEKAIRAKHRTMHMKPNPPTTPGWYNPPSIMRLLRYENPIPMVGDPHWERKDSQWTNREKAVYAAAMEAKRA